MKTRHSRLLTLCLVSSLALGALAACQKDKPVEKDRRLNEVGRFDLNWPPTATTLEGAVAEVEAKIGPGLKRSGGMVEWTARVDDTHCARIQLKDEGGKLSATSERLLERHPDFAACIAGN
ncbi:MAG: hypothetical protein AMXMBFR34_35270 [Myxococcaceae bacterium]